ncbi:HD domain-containing protein [Haloplasma contractile]|uniref:Metal dependent phosphohydrolase protein n=1 Tax=Haloplasma contractile SSD-17B TaxID=1033810 RepID=F7Q113_9MOLU|nr:HD domain-containing protein [Haloplasma contractile]ERJ11344.1 metal dependent phosphohydrolase protein [Haloplasma contractile SSD-17B]
MKTNQGKNFIRLPMKRLNRILALLLKDMKDLNDEGRELPIRWNIMHMYSSVQIAKLLAFKRGINTELAAIAAALHDIGVVKTKKRKDHAQAAKPFVYEYLNLYNSQFGDKLGEITEEEIELIVTAIVKHSEKEKIDEHPFIELLKDVDSVDRYLHGVITKSDHLNRCKRVTRELNLESIIPLGIGVEYE